MAFIRPSHAERFAAVEPVDELPERVQRALDPSDDFEPVPTPGPHDWLANHPERGQSFADWLLSRPNMPDEQRATIYLQPLGRFEAGASPRLDLLQRFAAAFFSMDIKIMAPLELSEAPITQRQNPYTGQRQLLSTDILALLRHALPDDAYALLGITMVDLYPEPSWNFVFGQASLRQRVGVYSFARYDPRFFGNTVPDHWRSLLLRRSCKVLAHETAHMFGIAHCVYFHCLMNGSNHLEESDARPLHLCPVDLRKLYHSVGFDITERYRRLRDFCMEVGFKDEAEWLDRRIKDVTDA